MPSVTETWQERKCASFLQMEALSRLNSCLEYMRDKMKHKSRHGWRKIITNEEGNRKGK